MSWEPVRRVMITAIGVGAALALALLPGVSPAHAQLSGAARSGGALRWTVALRVGAWGVTA